MPSLRHDWTLSEIEAIYTEPLTSLVFRAASVHREHHAPNQVQGCMLLSIKTGGCPEDCGYCPQAARYHTDVEHQPLMPVEDTLASARAAKEQGATRFCMGAAWRDVPKDGRFDRVLGVLYAWHVERRAGGRVGGCGVERVQSQPGHLA
jgi:biotin synthase